MRRGKGFIRGVALVLALVLAAMCFFFAVQGVEDGGGEQARQQLENALRRAAVACYAAEGVYPPTLDYITEHYGVVVDNERYAVFYEVFASNLMPEISVLEK